MINGIYIIKDNGICFAASSKKSGQEPNTDLMAPFFTALQDFFQVNFDGTLKGIIMDDTSGKEKHIYFRDIKIGAIPLRMVAVFDAGNYANKKIIDKKMLELKWIIQEKGYHRYLGSLSVPPDVFEELQEHIRSLFDLN